MYSRAHFPWNLLLHFPVLRNLRFSQYILGLVFHTIYSCIFYPCNFARIAFSTPAFSVPPLWFCGCRRHMVCVTLCVYVCTVLHAALLINLVHGCVAALRGDTPALHGLTMKATGAVMWTRTWVQGQGRGLQGQGQGFEFKGQTQLLPVSQIKYSDVSSNDVIRPVCKKK